MTTFFIVDNLFTTCSDRFCTRTLSDLLANSPIQDYVHPDDETQPTFEMTPGFKPLTMIISFIQEFHFDRKQVQEC